MRIIALPKFKRKARKLIKRNLPLAEEIDRKINLLIHNPSQQSLKLNKLTGFKESTWSISIKTDLRVLFVSKKGIIFLSDIGSHDEVY